MTIKQMASGRMVDLARLRVEDIDFVRDVAPALARICRYDGAMECAPFSVAQHSVMMADQAIDAGDIALAQHCILHDAHEAYLGDVTLPAAELLDAIMDEEETGFADTDEDARHFRVSLIIGLAKSRIDKPIFAAAGIAGDPGFQAVKRMDVRALATEKRHVLAQSQHPWPSIAGIKPFTVRGSDIRPWPVAKAETEWLDRLFRLCPDAQHILHWKEQRGAA